jgi:hypothetical protein
MGAGTQLALIAALLAVKSPMINGLFCIFK